MAALLMEATKKAGALDVQVTEQAWGGVSGVRGAGRYSGGKEGPGYQRILVLTCTCTCLYTGYQQENGFAYGHREEDGKHGREAAGPWSQCCAP